MNLVLSIRNRYEELINKKYAYDIYLMCVTVFSLLGWMYFSGIAFFFFGIFALLGLYLTNDFKLGLPFLLNFIFINNIKFEVSTDIIILIISGSITLIGIIGYVLYHKISFKKCRSIFVYISFSIITIIPILYIQDVKGNNIVYWLYFLYLVYTLLYVLVCNLVSRPLIDELCKVLTYLAVLIAAQCLYIHFTTSSTWYYLGWGLSNEANIFILFFMPFTVYLASKSDKTRFYYWALIAFMLVGGYFTYSRAFIVFGLPEIAVLVITYIVVTKRYLAIIPFSLVIGVILAVVFGVPGLYDTINKKFLATLDSMFSDCGRFGLYKEAIDKFISSPLNIIFGNGLFTRFDDANRVIVYHSTFFETLATMGILGIGALLYHMYLKYTLVLKRRNVFTIFLLISFVFNDAYGMVDNTYHMYYYMIVLTFILAVLERSYAIEDETLKESTSVTEIA